MITEEWKKFKGWYVLEYFLKTQKEVYVKELSRILNVSPGTANYYLRFYRNKGILNERKKGNLLLYSLTDNVLTRQLKIFYILDRMYPFVLEFFKQNSITSIILYGSAASGIYDIHSDVDILIISQQKELNLQIIKDLEEKLNREVKIHVFSLGEWRRLKKKRNKFALSVLNNHILLKGAEI